jgi:hypothetical protein
MKNAQPAFLPDYRFNACKPGVKGQVVVWHSMSGIRDTSRGLSISKNTVSVR